VRQRLTKLAVFLVQGIDELISARQEGNSDSIFRIFPADEGSDIPPRPSIQLPKYMTSYLWEKEIE